MAAIYILGTVTVLAVADNRKIGTGHQGPVCKQLKEIFKKVGVGKIEKYKNLTREIY